MIEICVIYQCLMQKVGFLRPRLKFPTCILLCYFPTAVSLVPRLLPAFPCCMRKMMELGKTYHVSDVAGRTDLTLGWFHPLRHSRDKFYQAPSFFFLHATLISFGVPGYEATLQ